MLRLFFLIHRLFPICDMYVLYHLEHIYDAYYAILVEWS